MDKKLLLEKYIKVAVRKALQEEEAKQKKATRAMYLVYRFPGLKDLMEKLMSPAFARFVINISVTAPKPTTFMVEMINGEDFSIRYDGRKNFTVKVAGKKYNIQQLSELERAQQAIADILELNYAVDEKDSDDKIKKDAGVEAFNAAVEAPPAEIPTEIPAKEPTATEIPTPEEEISPIET